MKKRLVPKWKAKTNFFSRRLKQCDGLTILTRPPYLANTKFSDAYHCECMLFLSLDAFLRCLSAFQLSGWLFCRTWIAEFVRLYTRVIVRCNPIICFFLWVTEKATWQIATCFIGASYVFTTAWATHISIVPCTWYKFNAMCCKTGRTIYWANSLKKLSIKTKL